MAQKNRGIQGNAEKEICVCGIFNGRHMELFEAGNAMDLLQLARLLRTELENSAALGPDLADAFGKRSPLDQEGFDLLVGEFMRGAQHIRGMFTINLEKKKVSVLDRAEGWMDYQIKVLSAAAYYACRKESRTEAERRAIFLDRLRGKTLNRPLHPEAELTFGM